MSDIPLEHAKQALKDTRIRPSAIGLGFLMLGIFLSEDLGSAINRAWLIVKLLELIVFIVATQFAVIAEDFDELYIFEGIVKAAIQSSVVLFLFSMIPWWTHGQGDMGLYILASQVLPILPF